MDSVTKIFADLYLTIFNDIGSLTLCGAMDGLTKPVVAFVRLSESKVFTNALEIPLPLRFIFVVLTPKKSVDIDCHEVGRAFSTLMSSKYLQKRSYSIATKGELLNAVNDFMDESFVLPDIGNWEQKNLLSFQSIQEMRERTKKLRGKGKYNEKADLDLIGSSGLGIFKNLSLPHSISNIAI